MSAKKRLSPAAAMALAGFLAASGPAAAAERDVLGFEIKPTVFFLREGNGLRQRLAVTVENGGAPTSGELAVRLEGRDLAFPLGAIPKGRSSFAVDIPEIVKPARAAFTLKAGGLAVRRDVALKPERKWSVYLFHHSHTDIGYTELQTRVEANHVAYLDSVIDYCQQTDAYPDDAKFRWNIEVSWALQLFRKTRPESRLRELVDLIKAGRVELTGFYLNQSDGFSHEELIRSVELARDFARANGFDVVAAMNDDVTGFGWALPQILRQAGIKYFATGINETRSRAPLRRPCAFWWESPDGSRILHWNGEHYLYGNYELLLHEPLAKSSPKVDDYLAKLEARGDYPYDLIAFNISAWVTDNCPPGRGLSDRVKEWNETFAYPKLRLATLREYFGALEKKYGAGLPTHKLGWPDYWTDGVASTAFETGLNRVSHNELVSAEKWSAFAARFDKGFRFPGDEIRDAYDQAMLYDEHTWGAYNSIDEPQSELARGQWAHKSGYAYRAREASRTLLRRGTEALAGLISAGGGSEFAVLNPLSWPRTEVVRVTLPPGPLREAKGKLRVIDRRLGGEAQFQPDGDGAILVLARSIPSMGYAVYSVVPAQGAVPVPGGQSPSGTAPGEPDGVLENRFYKVTVDPKTGGIASLIDKETGRDLVDKSCPWPLNTYIYEQPEGGRKAVDDMEKRAVFHRWSPEAAKVAAGWRGPVASSLVVTSSAKMCPALEQRIVLYDDIKRLDLVNVLNKEETFEPEAVYFSFPFKVGEAPAQKGLSSSGLRTETVPAGPDVRFEISDADMAPGKEQLPGTTLDWHTVQHWVEFSGRDARVIWSPVEAPLVMFGDINIGKWLKTLDLKNAWVFSYAMNNYWMTNFKASQEGRVEFRYSLTSLPPAAAGASAASSEEDRVAASRFGWEVHTPLSAVWLPVDNKGPFEAASESLLAIDRPNVVVQALMLDGDGRAVIRLREIAGRPAEVRVSGRAIAGSPAAPVAVSLKPFEIKTVTLAPAH